MHDCSAASMGCRQEAAFSGERLFLFQKKSVDPDLQGDVEHYTLDRGIEGSEYRVGIWW
jgi:hypothetical protein